MLLLSVTTALETRPHWLCCPPLAMQKVQGPVGFATAKVRTTACGLPVPRTKSSGPKATEAAQLCGGARGNGKSVRSRATMTTQVTTRQSEDRRKRGKSTPMR